jgi:hypothetical protein
MCGDASFWRKKEGKNRGKKVGGKKEPLTMYKTNDSVIKLQDTRYFKLFKIYI